MSVPKWILSCCMKSGTKLTGISDIRVMQMPQFFTIKPTFYYWCCILTWIVQMPCFIKFHRCLGAALISWDLLIMNHYWVFCNNCICDLWELSISFSQFGVNYDISILPNTSHFFFSDESYILSWTSFLCLWVWILFIQISDPLTLSNVACSNSPLLVSLYICIHCLYLDWLRNATIIVMWHNRLTNFLNEVFIVQFYRPY